VAGHFWDKVAACLGGGIGFYTLKQHQLVSVSDMDPPFVMDWKLASLSYFCFGIYPMVEPTPTCSGLEGLIDCCCLNLSHGFTEASLIRDVRHGWP
jgi:hypothetical protein